MLKHNKIYTYLGKYLSGESNNEESIQVKKWIESSNKNKILFEKIQSDWNKINLTKNMKRVDVDSAWENLKQRILKEKPEMIPVKEPAREGTARIYLYRSLQIAASILIIIGIAYGINRVFIESGFTDDTTVKSGMSNTSVVLLPDGSKVYLNSRTTVKYDGQYGTDSRNIYLKGEAYFEVVKDQNKPFIVNTNNAKVKVLGTSFNINTEISKNEVEVFVEYGNVQLSQKSDSENNILIEPGYIGVLSDNKLTKSKNNDVNYLAWKTRYLTFRETKLEIVAEKLESVYNTNIQFDNLAIADCKLTATFNNASLDTILKVIEGSFNLQIENIIKTNGKVIIVGSGC
ncbi:MAG: FecR domain-containing protein [Bacteroidales bacterium]|nr:MAG: FecR domain-containing protein [Bacteroidales bacterium]